ncbi:unnamed protein product [Symbiodinium microadriaticum]|nr:unnamed protein product [Symbiodinium microadriaticum]CAE7638529.1 unnamed protein product [Symbiodinium sp. KB8]
MDKETRPLIHTTAPDLKVSEALLEEFQEDAEQAKIDGAVAEQLEVQKAARLAAAQGKVDAANRKDARHVAKGSKVKTGRGRGRGRGRGAKQEVAQEPEEEEEAAELKRGGVPVPPGFKGAAKSYTLAATTYHSEDSDASSISVLCSICMKSLC